MENITTNQCPNCWGYQEYNEQFPEREMCSCDKSNK